MDVCKHPLLYLFGTGRASQETVISGSWQQALVGIHNSVWVWCLYMRWITKWGSLWMAIPLVSALKFISVTPSMGILFPLLRRTDVSTLWSSFFLSFMCFVNCILRILSFWANIYLYHVCSFVYLTQDDILKNHPFAKVFNKFIVFNSCIVPHCVNVQHFLFLFFCWGTPVFFPGSGYYK